MARTQTMVQLSDELLTLLDQRAARAGVSRSHLIRDAVEAYFAADREAEIDRQIVQGYRRMPQGGEHDRDDWGDLGVAVTAWTAELLRGLDEEDRDAGLAPW